MPKKVIRPVSDSPSPSSSLSPASSTESDNLPIKYAPKTQKYAPKTQTLSARPRRARRVPNIHQSMDNVKIPAMKRLAHVGGVTQVSDKDVYDEVRGHVTERVLRAIIKNAIILAEHDRKKRVSSEHVVRALETLNWRYASSKAEHKAKRCKVFEEKAIRENLKDKTSAYKARTERKIRHYQGQADCIHIARSGFQELVKSVGESFSDSITITSKAVAIMQTAVESYMVGLFHDAFIAAKHAGRAGISPKDIQLVLELRANTPPFFSKLKLASM